MRYIALIAVFVATVGFGYLTLGLPRYFGLFFLISITFLGMGMLFSECVLSFHTVSFRTPFLPGRGLRYFSTFSFVMGNILSKKFYQQPTNI